GGKHRPGRGLGPVQGDASRRSRMLAARLGGLGEGRPSHRVRPRMPRGGGKPTPQCVFAGRVLEADQSAIHGSDPSRPQVCGITVFRMAKRGWPPVRKISVAARPGSLPATCKLGPLYRLLLAGRRFPSVLLYDLEAGAVL